MKRVKLILVLGLALVSINTFAQKERKYIRQGNKEFDNSQFDNSEISYRKAADLQEQKSHETDFNIGDALYKQEKYEDAISQFNDLSEVELSKEEKARIYHNLGNSLMKTEKYKESIDAFKNALRNNPNDMDTKYNLVYAQKKLDEQQQQQQQDQNKDQNKDENKDQNQDQNKDKENQDQDKNEDKKDQDQNQDKQDQNKEQQQQQPQISKEDAERLLKSLAGDEKKTQQKVKEQQAAAAKVKTEKEW